MVRELVKRAYNGTLAYIEYAGTSLDTKPETGLVTGSRFTEADTGDVYMFYEADTPAWGKIIAGPTQSDG